MIYCNIYHASIQIFSICTIKHSNTKPKALLSLSYIWYFSWLETVYSILEYFFHISNITILIFIAIWFIQVPADSCYNLSLIISKCFYHFNSLTAQNKKEHAESHLDICQISTMKLFTKIVNCKKPLPILANSSIIDVWQGPKYASDTKFCLIHTISSLGGKNPVLFYRIIHLVRTQNFPKN